MRRIAAEVGIRRPPFSPARGSGIDARYFSPKAEVAFCGHATIATAVAYAERHGAGALELNTQTGLVLVNTAAADGGVVATLTSVAPKTEALDAPVLDRVARRARLGGGGSRSERAAKGRVRGAFHPVIAAGSRARLADLSYDFERSPPS